MATRNKRKRRKTSRRRKASPRSSSALAGAVVLTAAQFRTLLAAARKGKAAPQRRRRANPFEEEVLSMYDGDYMPWVGDFSVKFPSTSSTKRSASSKTEGAAAVDTGEPISDEVPTQKAAKIS